MHTHTHTHGPTNVFDAGGTSPRRGPGEPPRGIAGEATLRRGAEPMAAVTAAAATVTSIGFATVGRRKPDGCGGGGVTL